MGDGGKHPAATAVNNISGDTAAKANGPTTQFNIDIESLKLHPIFYSYQWWSNDQHAI